MLGTCFSSDLGARAVQCDPQNVSGTQRYRFFATALTNDTTILKFKKRRWKPPDTKDDYNDKNEKKSPQPCFQHGGTQTEEVRPISPPQDDYDQPEKPQPLTQLQLEKIDRENERKEQEEALPPLTDKESLEAYRVFLEENEKKDFALREKELDEKMSEKMRRIEKNLYERYAKDTATNQKKIELIRKSKVGPLKRKESVLEHDKISDISNKIQEHYFNVVDTSMNMYTNMKHNKGHLPMFRTSCAKKTQADLDLITSCFENR